MRLRHLVTIGPRPPIGTELHPDADVTFVPMEAIADGLGGLDISQTRPFSEVVSGSYNYFAEGDLLLAKVTPCFENGKKALAQSLSNGIGYATSEVHVIRPGVDRIHPKYLFYLLCSEDFRAGGIASMTGAGGLRRVSDAAVLNYQPSVTNLPTQKAIADFLDRETTRIDQLIEKKRRMVEVLGEKRQVVISRAVTKGLDPDVPMKDSGTEWLGENPVHWDITRLKRLAAMQAGTSITSDDIESEGDYPVFGGNGVRGFTSSYTHDGEFPLIGRQGALCGCVNFATGQFWASEHAVVCTPNAKVCSRWLAQLLQAMSLNRYSQSAAQPGLSVEAIGLIAAPKLSYAEQRGIVAFLDRETANIDALVAKVGGTRDRLREFRSALITAAVTGQINVSTWGKQGMTDRRLDQIEETKSA